MPDKAPVLEAHWRAVIDEARRHPSLRRPAALHRRQIDGRTDRVARGGAARRRASPASSISVIRCIRPGKPDQRRDRHLPDITEPMLFVQGTRDPFGTAAEIRELLPRLNPRTTLFEVPDGDHSFKVRVSVAGKKQDAVLTEIFDTVAGFVKTCASSTSR